MNEPSPGNIGLKDFTAPPGPLRLGLAPCPLESMRLGDGQTLQLDLWNLSLLRFRRAGRTLANPEGLRAWKDGVSCIWRKHGVWDTDGREGARLLRPSYFSAVDGRTVDFTEDYYKPFARRFAERMQRAHPGAAIFLETAPGHAPPRWEADDPENIVWAPHWYDGLTLFLKRLVPFLGIGFDSNRFIVGRGNIRRRFAEELAGYRRAAQVNLRNAPVLIGEVGIPFDLDRKRAYRTGDFRQQEMALDRSLEALEANLLSATLWNYTSDNSNDHGDQWNDEDFSFFSRDQLTQKADLDSGGRALDALVRPYPMAVAGDPLRMSYNRRSGVFEFEFRHEPEVAEPTICFVPRRSFPDGNRVTISDGEASLDADAQLLTYRHSLTRETHLLRLERSA